MSTISQFDGEDIGQHIRAAELLALLKRSLTPAQTARLQNHLPGCEQCQALYQDVNDFALPRRAEEAVVSEAQIQASWNQLKAQLLPAQPPVAIAAPRPMALAAAAGASWRWALPLAAALLLTLSVVSVKLWRDRQAANAPALSTAKTSADTSMPPVNQPTLPASTQGVANPKTTAQKTAVPKTAAEAPDKTLALVTHDVATLLLNSGEKGEAAASSPQLLQIPSQAGQLRFKFTRYKPTEFPSYQVELLNAQGQVKQVATGWLKKGGSIEAIFRRDGLTDGEYQLRVTGQGRADGDLTPLTTTLVKLSFKAH